MLFVCRFLCHLVRIITLFRFLCHTGDCTRLHRTHTGKASGKEHHDSDAFRFCSAGSRGLMCGSMWFRAPALVHALLSAIGSALCSLLITPLCQGDMVSCRAYLFSLAALLLARTPYPFSLWSRFHTPPRARLWVYPCE